ncbi:MAG: glycine cleavage T C-terminal barrel domain-containing protein [Gammaproteobacteria bacterium]|nr:glycine cleavage T C-terminal barrel domain-containing protein [Gammaproteobacteria bacterium]
MTFAITLGSRIRKSPYFDATVKAGVTHFTVYNHMYMPVSYGDTEGEYWRLIRGVSMWDVAAERQVEIAGPDAEALVRYLTPRNLSRCRVGRARYVPMCDHDGTLINDPVLLRLSEERFWLSIADSDMIYWVKATAAEGGFDVGVGEPDVSPLALQGPKALDVAVDLFGDQVRRMRHFHFHETSLEGIPLVLCRSGWSRQGGFEFFLRDGRYGNELWDAVARAGAPYDIRAGAPNFIERVESGLLSFAADNEPDSSPFELGLGDLVDVNREDDFIGKPALARIAAKGAKRRRVGLFIEGEKLPGNEHPWPVSNNSVGIGSARAAVYSLRLERNIAIALVCADTPDDAPLRVQTPYGPRDARIAALPFA